MDIPFAKYHGTGNDFIMIDNRDEWFPEHDHQLIARLCRRRFGIGADGLICLHNHAEADFRMVYFNADGKESSMCGNGGRCAVTYAQKLELTHGDSVTFEAVDGIHKAIVLQDATVSLQMADVTNIERKGEDFIIDTGSPHYIRFCEDVDQVDVFGEGQSIRNRPEYVQEGINVNFVEAGQQAGSRLRTYERGVEAETYSCGTGAVAAAIALGVKDKDASQTGEKVSQNLETKGGMLIIHYQLLNERQAVDIWLEGPATEVFMGNVEKC